MLRFIKLLGILALVLSSEASPRRYHNSISRKSQDGKLKAAGNYRLSPDVVPKHYKIDLTLQADFVDKKVFSGNVEIQFRIKKETKSFNIHMQDIEVVGDVTLKGPDNKAIEVTTDGPAAVTNFFTITSTENLPVSEDETFYTLTISYTGHLSVTDMDGFYLSSYKTADATEYLATTQFEEMGARRAFPCFDEPKLKANFDISITYPKEYNAMSNTKGHPPADTEGAEGLVTVIFPQTDIMSTYLVAFIVSKFTCTDGTPVDNIPTQLCSRNDTREWRDTALAAGSEVLDAMHTYTGMAFNPNMGKMSQAAIPDFAAGAMENYGMVTYREADLLWNKDESSNAYKQSIVTVVNHELSHQWFGDWVTLSWWSDIFLNEGFATYFEYHATDIKHGPWELPKQFVVEEVQTALLTDSMGTSLPLHYVESDDPNDISSRFDDISYNKGGSILRMVHHFLTLDKFKAGLNVYLQNNRIGTPEALWAALKSVPEIPTLPAALEDIMKNWINEAGYPLLTVTAKGTNVTISQEAFVLSGDAPKTKWYVPISYAVDTKTEDFADTKTKEWLTPDADLVIPNVLDKQKWIILNNQHAGYYRVNYDKNSWNKISTALNAKDFSNIDEISRSQIADDLLNLARAGKKDYTDVLKLLSFLKNDDSYYSWYPAFNGFNYLLQRTVDKTVRNELTAYITNLMKTLYKSTPIGQEKTDDQIYTLKQVLALTWACKLNDKDCINFAKTGLSDYVKDATKKPTPNMKSIVYCHGLRNSDDPKSDYDFLWKQYVDTDLATEKVTMLKALGCANNSTVRKEYLKTALTEDVRIQDITYVFSSVYSNNPGGVDDVLDFINEQYKAFPTRFGDSSPLNSLISAVGDYLTTQAQIDKLQKFANTATLDDDTKSSATNAITAAKANLDVTKALETKLKTYFDSSAPSSASMNSYHLINVAFVLVGYMLYNLY